MSPHARTHPPVARTRRPDDLLLPELRRLLAAAGQLRLDLLGESPVSTSAEVAARVDALARELLTRMRDAGWAEAAAPSTVTSVLAASAPEVESVLLRAARARR